MSYVVTSGGQNGECTEHFLSEWGILAGDTASPDLFNVYVSDFRPPSSPFHVSLDGRSISHLENAGDMILFTRHNAPALQNLIDYTYNVWCIQNFLSLNVSKTVGMIFGPVPNPLPVLAIGQESLVFTDHFKYVGITFQSTHRNIFFQHYINKASAACLETYKIFAAESLISAFPMKEGLQLYMALVDPHLTFGCEVCIDIDSTALKLLEDVQVMCLRHLLGLPNRCF